MQSFLEALEPNPLSRSRRLLCQKSVPCDCRTKVPIPYGCQPGFLLSFYRSLPYPLPWYSSSISKSAMVHCVLICHVSLTSTSASFLLYFLGEGVSCTSLNGLLSSFSNFDGSCEYTQPTSVIQDNAF